MSNAPRAPLDVEDWLLLQTLEMPKHPKAHGPPRHRHETHSLRFVNRQEIDQILKSFLPDENDRRFVVRCLLDEGPSHHRGANWILLMLLARLAGGERTSPEAQRTVGIPLNLPPHLREGPDQEDLDRSDREYPLRMPLAPLESLAGGDQADLDAMIGCLVDGPPQHSLANAAMVALIDRALTRGSREG